MWSHIHAWLHAAAEDLVLDASGWKDPDDPNKAAPVSFSWDCAFEIATLPCFGGRLVGTREGSLWKIPMAAFKAPDEEEPTYSRKHTFSVSVSKGDGRAAAKSSVTVVPQKKERGKVLPTAVLARCGVCLASTEWRVGPQIISWHSLAEGSGICLGMPLCPCTRWYPTSAPMRLC